MKKISTVAVKQNRSFSEQKLTIGFDLGDRSSWYCVLATGSVLLGTEAEHDSESHEGSVRGDAAQPDRVGNGDAFALGQSVGERVGASACSSLLENRLTPPTLLEMAMLTLTTNGIVQALFLLWAHQLNLQTKIGDRQCRLSATQV